MKVWLNQIEWRMMLMLTCRKSEIFQQFIRNVTASIENNKNEETIVCTIEKLLEKLLETKA